MTRSLSTPLLLPLLLLLAAFLPSALSLTLSPLFTPAMVLQRAPHPARVWGSATPSTLVTVVLDSAPASTVKADADGQWLVTLPPQPLSLFTRTLTVTDSSNHSITLDHVAFGDVYLCAGQSNTRLSSPSFNHLLLLVRSHHSPAPPLPLLSCFQRPEQYAG